MAKQRGSFWNPLGFSKARVRQLHRRGFAVRGFMPGAPDALQPRLTSYLRKQAAKDIGLAYQPVEKELTSREARVNAIKNKRQADHQAYQSWLATQQATLRTEAEARQMALRTQVAQHQTETRDAMLQITQQAQTRQAAAGVSGTLDAGGVVSGAQRAAIETGAAKATALSEGQNIANQTLAATQANNIAYAKALEAKDFAKSLDELSEVADAKTKLALQKGSDQARRIAALLDMEVAKAQQAQQMQLAGQKLGVQLAGIRQRERANKRTTQTQKRGQDLTFEIGSRNAALRADELADKQRQDRIKNKLDRDKLAAGGDSGGASKQERAQRTGAIRAVNRMKSYMNDKLGNYKNAKRNKKKEDFNAVVGDLRKSYPNDIDLILVAYDLWRFGHLRPGSRNRWMVEYGYKKPKGW